MTDPFANGPRPAWPAHMPPIWPPLDPETGLVDPFDDSDPPDGFFVDPDVARRISDATIVAEGLPPAEALRDSNKKLSDLTRAEWELAVRRRAYEEAREFSFLDPPGGVDPVLAELSPQQVASVDRFTRTTGLQVDFPPQYGGYFARVRKPVEDREVGIVPRTVVFAAANGPTVPGTAGGEAAVSDSRLAAADGLARSLPGDRMRDLVLDLLPIVGNIRSGVEAFESYREADRAIQRGDWDAFLDHGGMGLLNTAGAIGGPLSGPLVRIVKAGTRQLVRKTPGAREVAAGIVIKNAKNRFDKMYDPIQVEKTLGKAFDDLTDAQKKSVKAIFPNAVGTAAERHTVRQLGDIARNATRKRSKTAVTVDMGGRTATRHFDAMIEEVQHNILVDTFRIFNRNARAVGVEVKGQASRSRQQMKKDRAIEADGSQVQQVLHLRHPIKKIPEKEFKAALQEMFGKHVTGQPGALTQKQVDKIVGRFVRLRRGHGDWVTGEVVVGIGLRAAANEMTWNAQDHRRREAERQAK